MTGPNRALHATTVAWRGTAVLITGAPGSGKSALALGLMAWGCDLVADDQTLLAVRDQALWATAHPRLAGRIEARGIGILTARAAPAARLGLAVAMDRPEAGRLPPARTLTVMGVTLPLLHNPGTGHFAAAILQYLKALKDSA